MVGVILAVTLVEARPLTTPREQLVSVCVFCGSRGAADAILNTLLFLPLGAALVAAGLGAAAASLGSLLLSVGIEAAQTGLVGRYAALGDVVWNTVGGGLGALLTARAGWLRAWVAGHRRAAGALLLALPLAIVGAGAWLLVPAPQPGTYYGQWTAELGGLGVYGGQVLEARIGDQPAPSWRLQDSRAAREAIRSGDPVRVVFIAGPPPSRLAPVFSVYDGDQDEVLLLGAAGDDLLLRARRRSTGLKLDRPTLRWAGALAELEPGDTVTLALRRAGAAGFCLRLDGRESCRGSPFSGWALLMDPRELPPALRPLVGVGWALALLATAAAGVGLLVRGAGREGRRTG